MKNRITILLCIIISTIGFSQTVEKASIYESLKIALHKIIELAAEENISELDHKYVSEKYGVFDVFRIGATNRFTQHNSIVFAFSRESIRFFSQLSSVADQKNKSSLVFRTARYDCHEMVLDKNGFFVTDSIANPKLSQIITSVAFESAEFPKSLHNKAKYIDQYSCRVVLTEIDLIFYLTTIEGRRYITFYDSVTTDCSA